MIFYAYTGHALAQSVPDANLPLMEGYLDQGKAEVSVYDATIMRYGHPREGKVTHIWVKEPWDAANGVKWGGEGRGDFEVIKLNQVISYPTGMYRYEQMWSGFWNRETGELVKFSLSHHEACGNTFKQARIKGNEAEYVHFSYFEGHGDGQRKIAIPANAIFYEELPLRLRPLVHGGMKETVSVPMFPTTIHAKSDPLEPIRAEIREFGRGKEGVEFEVTHPGGVDRLVYEADSPHKLLSWKMADGSQIRLRKSLFIDYWNHNRPGDEKLLE